MHLTRCKIDLYDCLYLYTIKTAVDWCRNGQSSKLAISDRRSGSDPQILGDLFCHYCIYILYRSRYVRDAHRRSCRGIFSACIRKSPLRAPFLHALPDPFYFGSKKGTRASIHSPQPCSPSCVARCASSSGCSSRCTPSRPSPASRRVSTPSGVFPRSRLVKTRTCRTPRPAARRCSRRTPRDPRPGASCPLRAPAGSTRSARPRPASPPPSFRTASSARRAP